MRRIHPGQVRGRVTLAIALLLLVLGRTDAASEYAVVVDLDVEAGEQPAYLCVVTARGGLTARNEPYSMPLSILENGVLQPERPGEDGRRFAASLQPDLVRAAQVGKREAIALALTLLTHRTVSNACSDSYDACTPRMWSTSTRAWFSRHASTTKSEDLHITCAANSATLKPSARAAVANTVAILSLDFIQGQDMPISELRLDGSAASIAVRGAIASSETAAVRVVGGDYVVGSSHFTTRGRVVVPLQPLCAVHPVRLPVVHLPATSGLQVTLRRGDDAEPIRTCTPSVAGNQLAMRLPHSTRRDDYTLAVTGPAVAMSTTWSAIRPPPELTLHVESIDFQWSPDCTYPLTHAGCPTATLDGVPCPPGPGEQCSYHCTTKGAFDLPSAIEFARPNSLQRWSATLRFPGQVITQYVDPGTRRVAMSFPGWDDLPLIERANISALELEFPNGNRKFVDLHDRMMGTPTVAPLDVDIPDVSCQAELKYRVVSDKFTEFERLQPSDGGIVLPVPRCRDLCLAPTLIVGIGTLNRGSGELPNTSPGNAVAVYGGFHIELLPWGHWYFFELGYSATLGSREYLSSKQGGPSSPSTLSSASALYGRVGYDLVAGLRTGDFRPILPPLRIGVGVTAGWGHVLDSGDGAKIHGDWYVTPSLFVRWGRISLVTKLMLFEELVEISSETGERLRDHSSVPLGYELRYTF